MDAGGCWSGGGGREGRGACRSEIPAALSARSCCPAEPSRAGPGTGGSQAPCEAGNLGENQFPRHQFIPIIPVGVASLRAEVGSRRALGSRQDLISAFSGREELQGMLQGWGCQVCACASTWTRDLVRPTHWAFHRILRSLWKRVFLGNLREF